MSNGAVKRSRASVPADVRRAGSGGLAWISAGNSSQHCRGVYRAAGHRPDVIHGWGKGEDPGPAHTSPDRFQGLDLLDGRPSGRSSVATPPPETRSGYVSPKSSPRNPDA